MKIKHYVVSDIEHGSIAVFDEFDKDKIRAAIIKQLEKEPHDLVTHEKTETNKKYWGNEILNIYEVNPKTGKPSLCITKGSKTIYKPLN